MNYTSAVSLITLMVRDVGTAMFAVLSAVLVIGVGYLIFKFGWRKVKNIAGEKGAYWGYTYEMRDAYNRYNRRNKILNAEQEPQMRAMREGKKWDYYL